MVNIPEVLEAMEQDTLASGFSMGSDRECGSLLRTLAASKPGGLFLELGTGTGLAAAWLLDGMDATARLVTVENDASLTVIALRHLKSDSRIDIRTGDAGHVLDAFSGPSFDLVFADTWIGKYLRLDETLALLKSGGLYIIDDLIPQPNWPEGHDVKANALRLNLHQRNDLVVTELAWSTGIIIGVKK